MSQEAVAHHHDSGPRAAGSTSNDSTSPRRRIPSQQRSSHPRYVLTKSISVATHHAWSSGHHKLADWNANSERNGREGSTTTASTFSVAASIGPASRWYERPGRSNVGAVARSRRNPPHPSHTANQQVAGAVVCRARTGRSDLTRLIGSVPSLGA